MAILSYTAMVKIGRPRSQGYQDFGFSVIKQGARCVAICLVCKRVLQNTAFVRLKGHRNICQPQASGEHQKRFIVPHNQSTDFTNLREPIVAHHNSQISTKEQLQQMVSQDSESLADDEDNENFSTQEQKHETDLKKVAILKLIYEHKNNIFEGTISAKSEAWDIVLKKAQLLGLAPADTNWTFARDSLYGTWKKRTLAKRDSPESSDKLDIVDLSILKILDKKPQPSASSVTGLSDLNGDYSLQDSAQNEVIQDGITEEVFKGISSEISDELLQTELKMKRLRCEILEIEAYKQRLQVLQLERELKLPPSTFTMKILESEAEPTSHVDMTVEQNDDELSPYQHEKLRLGFEDDAQSIEQAVTFIKDEGGDCN